MDSSSPPQPARTTAAVRHPTNNIRPIRYILPIHYRLSSVQTTQMVERLAFFEKSPDKRSLQPQNISETRNQNP